MKNPEGDESSERTIDSHFTIFRHQGYLAIWAIIAGDVHSETRMVIEIPLDWMLLISDCYNSDVRMADF
jgi:hypothetical protein